MLAFGFADENVAGFVCPGGTRARGAGTPSSSPGPTPSGPPRGCRSSSFWSFWSTSSRVVVFEILSESVSLSSPKRVFFRCKRSYTIGFFLCAHNDTHTHTHTHTTTTRRKRTKKRRRTKTSTDESLLLLLLLLWSSSTATPLVWSHHAQTSPKRVSKREIFIIIIIIETTTTTTTTAILFV